MIWQLTCNFSSLFIFEFFSVTDNSLSLSLISLFLSVIEYLPSWIYLRQRWFVPSYIAGRVESLFLKKNSLVVTDRTLDARETGITFRRSTRGANVRTTCVGGSVLVSFTFAKSQSWLTPTASRPRHPSRPSSHPLYRPFVLPSGIVARASTIRSLSSFLSLFPSPLLSLFLFFSHDRERVCASSTRFIATIHALYVSFLSTNNNVYDNFFHYIYFVYSSSLSRSQIISLDCSFKEMKHKNSLVSCFDTHRVSQIYFADYSLKANFKFQADFSIIIKNKQPN